MRKCLLFFVSLSAYWVVAGASRADAQSKYDVVINEIFPDPSPVVGLPNEEFVELFNRTALPVSLKGWTFTDATSSGTFPDIVIGAGEHLIVCPKAASAVFAAFGRTASLSAWPSLNNAGETLRIKSDKGVVIDEIAYQDTWYGDAAKKAGGWTLERVDPDDHCSGSRNWKAAIDASGGTPGRKNSVFGQRTTGPFRALSASMTDSVTVRVSFTTSVDTALASKPAGYAINNGVGAPVNVTVVGPGYEAVDLKFSAGLRRGLVYLVSISSITDCAGTLLPGGRSELTFAYPDKIGVGDLLLSEILFNPRKGGVDFVEVYNPRDRVFDLGDVQLASVDEHDSLTSLKTVSEKGKLLLPGQYVAFTIDPANIRAEYVVKDTTAVRKAGSLPAFNDDKGTVMLVAGKLRIDRFDYSEKMHFPLIKDPEGVSLERSSFVRDANERGNFRSAAALAGFATPGYQNSQQVQDVSSPKEVFLTSTTFSPDNDGYEDELQVNFRFAEAGKVMSAAVYTERGKLVYRLARNVTVGQNGALSWNGLDEAGRRLPVGIYSLIIEVFDMNGTVKRYKRNCALAAKL